MRVTEVHVYPVKSCRGIALSRSAVGKRGLELGRRWMIVDDAGTFITQREAPRLARVDTALASGVEGHGLVLSAEGHGQVRVSATSTAEGRHRRVRVWKSEVDALDCGDEAARWLTAWLASAARLVFMPDDSERAVSPEYSRAGDIVGFADGFPVLVATTASLQDLNARLDVPVPMNRFRPNIVVEGAAPWEEDSWSRLLLGDVPLRVVKPCGRCIVITTDQRTGERGVEPLRTLATFRQQGHQVNFAQNCVPDAPGTVAVGDALRVLSRMPS